MTLTLIHLLFWTATRARAATDRDLGLEPRADEVTVRGVLRETAHDSGVTTWGVYRELFDEMVPLAPGDRLFIFDESGRKLLAGGAFESVRSVVALDWGDGVQRLPIGRPGLRGSSGLVVAATLIRRAIDHQVPVVLFKICAPAERAARDESRLRRCELWSGQYFELRPDEFVITGEPRVTVETELRHAIDFAAVGFTPPRLCQELILSVGREGGTFAPVVNNDLVFLAGEDGHVLARRRMLEVGRKHAAPFRSDEIAWARALARTRRVTVVRRK